MIDDEIAIDGEIAAHFLSCCVKKAGYESYEFEKTMDYFKLKFIAKVEKHDFYAYVNWMKKQKMEDI